MLYRLLRVETVPMALRGQREPARVAMPELLVTLPQL